MAITYDNAETPPGTRLYAIGDVHGRLDLLSFMLDRIRGEIARDRPADWRIILLGDYIDRGPQSRGVLDLLATLTDEGERLVLLEGNHDRSLRDFLESPDHEGLFALYGGASTVASYGVEPAFGDPEAAARTATELAAAMPARHVALLESLRDRASLGDFFFAHAGIRPGVPLAKQTAADLLWIRSAFHDYEKAHPKLIVHGHTPVPAPDIRPNRVNVDTRAYESGVLSALVAEDRNKRIMQVVL